MLRDTDGPLDLSREENVEADGGFDVIESNWLEGVNEEEQREYKRAKGMLLYAFLDDLLTGMFAIRVAGTISSKFPAYGHYSVAVPVNPRKGCICMVV